MPRRRQFRRQALPLPASIFAFGVSVSVALHFWLKASRSALVKEFSTDSAILSHQVAARVKRDVDEKSTATFIEWNMAGLTREAWVGFTEGRGILSDDGAIGWAPRIRNGNVSVFEELARDAYPDSEVLLTITRASESGVLTPVSELSGSHTEDMWPVLFAKPASIPFIGYDVASMPSRREAIERMVETHDTAVTEALIVIDVKLPGFVVFQPVFAHPGNSSTEIVGCTVSTARIQDFLMDTLEAMEYSRRHPGAQVAVFLRVAGDGGASEDQLLFDLSTHPAVFLEGHSGNVTPLAVERRGGEVFTRVISVTARRSIVVVCSFDPNDINRTSWALLMVGALTSLLVASLLYGRQMLVLSYKDGMETARLHSVLKTRFVADMVHEIRTPLTGIIGTAELLAEQKMPSDTAALIGTVQACSRILMGLVNDALDFAKIEAGELHVEARPVFLRHVLSEVLSVMRTTYRSPRGEPVADLLLRLEVADSVVATHALADEARIRQVLVNLMSNAFKFTDCGTISVVARLEPVVNQLNAAVQPRLGNGGGAEDNLAPPSAPPLDPGTAPPSGSNSPTSAVHESNGQASSPRSDGTQPETHASEYHASVEPLPCRDRSTPSPGRAHDAVATGTLSGAVCANAAPASTRPPGKQKAESCTLKNAARVLGYNSRTPFGISERAVQCFKRKKPGASVGGSSRGVAMGCNVTPAFERSLSAHDHEKMKLVVDVTDTGVGMEPEQIAKLFKPFSQVHHESARSVGGTGLGLAICKSLCESMGGTISCESSLGRGTTFRFSALVGVPKTAAPLKREDARRPLRSAGSTAHEDFARSSNATFVACTAHAADGEEPTVGGEAHQPLGKRPPPCILTEWNLATEGSKYSVTTDVLKRQRHKRSKSGTLDVTGPLAECLAESPARQERLKQGDAAGGRETRSASVVNATAEVPGDLSITTSAGPRKGRPPADGSVAATAAAAAAASTTSAEVKPTPDWADFSKVVQSRAGAGAATEGACPQVYQPSRTSPERGERPRLLVVDDFRMNRALVCKMLEALDAHVEVAEDGAKAVELCGKLRFSVILMDLMMPVMNGIEATRAIRSGKAGDLNCATPVVALTARATAEGTEAGAEDAAAGITDTLPKPMTRMTLFAMIAKWASEAEVVWMRDAWLRYTAEREAHDAAVNRAAAAHKKT